MKIVAVSDLHTFHPLQDIPNGDVLVCSGDITFTGVKSQVEPMLDFLSKQPHKHKILVAGNHDWLFEEKPKLARKLCKDYGITYLEDSGIEIGGVKFWGSPVQPEFCNWAFNRSTHNNHSKHPPIKPHWDMIPEDTDVLITHGPAYGILDKTADGLKVGCPHLLKRIKEVKPSFHFFGHIHEGYGTKKVGDTLFINASTCTRRYQPINKPIIVNI